MKFSEQKFFHYEETLWRGCTLASLFRDKTIDAGLLNISGLADLKEALLITDEWYRQYPVLTLKEVESCCSDGIDRMDGEPVDGILKFVRTVNVHAALKQDDPVVKLMKTGRSTDQNVKFHIGLLQLYLANYWPGEGDRLFYRGVLHDVIQVVAAPVDYWQNSAVPMHITVTAVISNLSGNLPGRALESGSLALEPAWLMPAMQPNTEGGGGVPQQPQGSGSFDGILDGSPELPDASCLDICSGGEVLLELTEDAVTQETYNW